MAAVILIFPGDVGHHSLEALSVALFVVLMNQEGMNHFVNQGSLNLGKVIALIPKQLIRQVNLGRLKSLAASVTVGKSFGKPASLIAAVTCSGGHPSIPYNRNVWNLAIEMLIV